MKKVSDGGMVKKNEEKQNKELEKIEKRFVTMSKMSK